MKILIINSKCLIILYIIIQWGRGKKSCASNILAGILSNEIIQGRCNEGFNAEPIAFCILHFEFKFPAKNSGEKFRFGQKFMVWVKMLGSGENVGFGQKF